MFTGGIIMLDQYKRILVAVDGSKEAERAFFKAVNVAKRNEATLIITHILDIGAYTTFEGFDKSLTDRVYNYAEELLNDYAEKAKEAGLEKVEKVLEYGSPKVKIAKEIAKEQNVDLILCGATGLNAVERFIIDSVSEYIIRYAPCDVLVVR